MSAVRWLSTVPITGRHKISSQTRMIGVASARIVALCRSMSSSLSRSSRSVRRRFDESMPRPIEPIERPVWSVSGM